MSLLWRDRLLISLAPGELSWVRLSGLLKPEVRARNSLPFDHAYGAHNWDGAVAALRSQVPRWEQDKLTVRLVLSNHFVRYVLVPHSDSISGHDEEMALARFHFTKVHGDASRDWDMRLSPGKSSGTRMACAVNATLVDAIRQSFPSNTRLRLASIQPLLMSVFNSGNTAIPSTGAWLVVVEPDRACVALITGMTWRTVQNIKGQFGDTDAWIDLVERERWRVNLDTVPDTILIHSPKSPVPASRTHGAWKIAGLQTYWPAGLSPASDGAYGRALSAA